MRPRTIITGIVLLLAAFAFRAAAANSGERELERRFAKTVQPFLETYCFACHGKEKQKGKLDLSHYSTVEAVAADYRRWELVVEKLKSTEMPPEEAQKQPLPKQRQAIIDWIQAVRRHEAQRNAGDRPVLARRLSNAEYDYTIRDLTGVDIRPTQEFPVDPANEAGFDNSGESLAMSPTLLKKYLEAARRVAEHVVLKPKGFVFAPHPVVTETDRDKYCVKRIIDFYQRQPTNYVDYFMAAWRFKNRATLGKPAASLGDFAAENKISSKYLATIWSALATTNEEIGPSATLQAMWRELPAPIGKQQEAARPGCERMRDFVVELRQKLKPQFTNLTIRGIAAGSQPLVLWKDRQYAAHRLHFNRGALQIQSDPKPPNEPTPGTAAIESGNRARNPAATSPSPPKKEERAGERRRPQTDQTSPLPYPLPAAPGEGEGRQSLATAQASTITTLAEQALIFPDEEAARERYEAAFDRFCRIFPDAFFVSERGLIFLKEDKESRGRLLSAGFHLMVGYFRDDAPLYELILDEQRQHELDALWEEFHFITLDAVRQYKDFIFFERAEPPRFMQGAEFDFARSEDKDATSKEKIKQLAEAYLAKARRNGGEGQAIAAIEDYFKSISADIRWVEQTRLAAEPSHLEALQAFAQRAYRRPLSQTERDDLLAFYRSLREQDGLSHEDALRDTVISVLMSPYFCYRIDLAEASGQSPHLVPPPLRGENSPRNSLVEPLNREWSAGLRPGLSENTDPRRVGDRRSKREVHGEHVRKSRDGKARFRSSGSLNSMAVERGWRPLSDYALASRLSYFLWSSMPDEELLAHAAAGDLHRPTILVTQARRMLRDDRVRGLATEFGGNWLDFRRFEEHNAVDRERFKSFNHELRQAMFEEPLRFFVDLVRADRSVLDFLYGDYTFVNPILAKHYGITDLEVRSNEWVRVADARRYERGGLLPMSVFLTKNAPGLRTSPVKRGYWVVRRLLGEQIPPPPPTVPELPTDEAKLGDLTLREVLARHRDDKSCAGCHERFDAIGLVFEGYGPVGERRIADFGGRPVDTHATFPGGTEGTGLDGLRRYLRENRQQEFLDNLCRKLLGYALGRTLLLSDDATIKAMRVKLAANGYRFGTLVESIVTSQQFLTKRGQEDLMKK